MKHRRFKDLLEIKLCSIVILSIFMPFSVLCAIMYGYGTSYIAAYIAALLHEAAHILCAKKLGVKISHIILYPFGVSARLDAEHIRSSSKEFAIAFAGPFASLVMFWVLTIGYNMWGFWQLKFGADVNLAICTINLIPALPLDGGRMLRSALTAKYGIIRASNLSLKLSRILIFGLVIAAPVMFFVYNFNFSLVLISAFLLENISHEQASASRVYLDEILHSRKKLDSANFYGTKTFAARENTPAAKILRFLSYDYLCVIHVVNQKGEIIRTLSETNVLDSLIEKGTGIKLKDI